MQDSPQQAARYDHARCVVITSSGPRSFSLGTIRFFNVTPTGRIINRFSKGMSRLAFITDDCRYRDG